MNAPGKPIEDIGECVRLSRRFLIRIEPRVPWRISVETLLHEWAHAVAWGFARMESGQPDHSDEWALAYARAYRAFYEDHGDEHADDYPWR